MNLYALHTNPEQLEGYENRLRVPELAYEYGRRHGFKDELVSVVAKDTKYAYQYAFDVIRGRFPEGEAAIAKDPDWAYKYARGVIGGRWPEGEAAIAKDPYWAVKYEINFDIEL